MSLADDVKSMNKHTKDVYDSLEALGATIPANKNLANLVTTFDSIPLIPPSVTVTFDAGGGTPVPAPQTFEKGGLAIKPADPSKSGYVFQNWTLNGSVYNFNTPVTQNITLVADYLPIYTVTFNANGGTPAPIPQQVVSGQTATQPANPSKTGANFQNWTLNGNIYNFSTPVTSNITLEAAYEVLYDPANPTISGIKAALQAGDYTAFPAGTEIPDTYDGQNNPLIVGVYLDSSNNQYYDGAEGVLLCRKYAEPARIGWGLSKSYKNSTAFSYLQNQYYAACSTELKNLISQINVRYKNDGSGNYEYANGYWQLFGQAEMLFGVTIQDGTKWPYWINKTGISNFSESANSGRILYDRDGNAQNVWLRYGNGDRSYICSTTGAWSYISASGLASLLPWCFISKN